MVHLAGIPTVPNPWYKGHSLYLGSSTIKSLLTGLNVDIEDDYDIIQEKKEERKIKKLAEQVIKAASSYDADGDDAKVMDKAIKKLRSALASHQDVQAKSQALVKAILAVNQKFRGLEDVAEAYKGPELDPKKKKALKRYLKALHKFLEIVRAVVVTTGEVGHAAYKYKGRKRYQPKDSKNKHIDDAHAALDRGDHLSAFLSLFAALEYKIAIAIDKETGIWTFRITDVPMDKPSCPGIPFMFPTTEGVNPDAAIGRTKMIVAFHPGRREPTYTCVAAGSWIPEEILKDPTLVSLHLERIAEYQLDKLRKAKVSDYADLVDDGADERVDQLASLGELGGASGWTRIIGIPFGPGKTFGNLLDAIGVVGDDRKNFPAKPFSKIPATLQAGIEDVAGDTMSQQLQSYIAAVNGHVLAAVSAAPSSSSAPSSSAGSYGIQIQGSIYENMLNGKAQAIADLVARNRGEADEAAEDRLRTIAGLVEPLQEDEDDDSDVGSDAGSDAESMASDQSEQEDAAMALPPAPVPARHALSIESGDDESDAGSMASEESVDLRQLAASRSGRAKQLLESIADYQEKASSSNGLSAGQRGNLRKKLTELGNVDSGALALIRERGDITA